MCKCSLRPFLVFLVFIFSILGLSASDAPYRAFAKYIGAVKQASQVNAIYPHLSQDQRQKWMDVTAHQAAEQLKLLQESFSDFEPMYYEVERTGLRAEVTLHGLSPTLKDEASIDAIMLWEDKAWRFSHMKVIFKRKKIVAKVRTWKIGVNEVPIEALLKDDSGDKLELVTDDMATLKVRVDELSTEDMQYLKSVRMDADERFANIRAGLEAKARAAGQVLHNGLIIQILR